MLETMIAIMTEWRKVFSQQRTMRRAIVQAIASACLIGRRTLARVYLCTEQYDWSGEYKLHSRSKWASEDLFNPILKDAVNECPGDLLPFGTDDTRVGKSGKKIESAYWGRDPLGPKFHLNLKYAIRYLHTSVLLPLHRYDVSARALPVWFEEATPVKKPGKKATAEQRAAYNKAQKEQNLSVQAVRMFRSLRKKIDDLGGAAKTLVFALDGSFCNKTVFKAALERTILIARARKDAVLCFAAKTGKKIYSDLCFTPEAIREDKEIAYQTEQIFHGGRWREIGYKEVKNVLWRNGSGRKPLRLFVIKPTPYRKTRQGRVLYRKPAYLLSTDVDTEAKQLLQIYFDRWQVEVAHKEMKQDLGLGQAQVRVAESIKHQPALTAATYSIMHLAAIRTFGLERSDKLGAVPRYQREKSRASSQDLIRYLRREVINKPHLLPSDYKITANSLFAAAS